MGSVSKSNILLVGSGGVGTMAAYALESGGKASVTAILRSNFAAVDKFGITIDSIEHGQVKGWKPTKIRQTVPDVVGEGLPPYDYIVVTTKNIADVKPTVAEIIAPAVTPGHTTIVLMQNGLNIEKPVIAAFPQNNVLSGVSLIGATEVQHGSIRHDDNDIVILGPFTNPNVPAASGLAAAKEFAQLYNACGKVDCQVTEDVAFSRWRKLVYNACYNSISTMLKLDTSRIRISEHIVDNLVRPAMWEIYHTAKAAGVDLPDDIVEKMVVADPFDTFFKPSMCQDIEKGNYIEFENIVGEPLREAEKYGVPTPTLKVIYGALKGLQWKTMEAKGLITIPPKQVASL